MFGCSRHVKGLIMKEYIYIGPLRQWERSIELCFGLCLTVLS